MATDIPGGEQLRGGRIHLADLTDLEIRDCQVGGLRIVDCYGSDIHLSGDFERVVVNDVEVGVYVEAELDRQHPLRAMARNADTVADYRTAWDAVEATWQSTLERVLELPAEVAHTRVDGEWSLVETLRHLLFASDAWVGNAVLDEREPCHPLGLPAGGTPPETAASVGLTVDATASLDEVLAARRSRAATIRELMERVTDAELDRVCGRRPAHFYPDQSYVVRRCLRVVLREEAEHHRYAVRDLATLDAGR